MRCVSCHEARDGNYACKVCADGVEYDYRCKECHDEFNHDIIVFQDSVSVPMRGAGGATGFYGHTSDGDGTVGDESPWQANAIRAMEG